MKQLKKTLLTLVALLAVTTGAWAETGENIFQYCYDCQRNPAYPKTTASASLSGFSNPLVGYKGSGFEAENTSAGPWKLEYMGLWSTTDKHEIDDVTNYQDTYNCTDVPVFRLYQWNATANEYQHAAYGVVCAYAKVSNAVEHTAFFEAADGWGCVLTNSSHSSSMNITFDEDLTTGLTTLIEAASPSSGPEVAWDKTAKTGTFTMPGGNVTLEPDYYPQATVADGGVTAADADARATTDDPLVKVDATKLTGAKKLMYFVSNSGTAPAYDAEGWTDQLPTAEGFTQQGIVYVYYYPVGTDEGVDGATATYSDGDICLQSITARIAAAPTYAVTFAEGTEESDKWKAEPAADVKKGQTVTVTYTGSKKVIGVKAEKKGAPAEEPMTLGTPLTIEAITDGTIVVNIEGTLSTGMKYSVNGGTKTTITSTTNIEGLKAGDKVQFYGNGTSTQVYGNSPNVKILGSGDGFQTKAYGNTMSLLDEEGFATKTDLPDATFVFSGLFSENTTLTDASELLLPATTLTVGCYYGMFEGCTSLTTAPKLPATTMATGCYRGMFEGCTSLTTAPKLPATTLAKSCYYTMFFNCTSLTSAYVKAAYTEENGECDYMFDLSKAAGAVLHTTPDNKASWETMMNKDWKNWTVADDWQD